MPLRLRFHRLPIQKPCFDNASEWTSRQHGLKENDNWGLTIFTSEPQQRSIITHGSYRNENIRKTRLWFPHTAFIFQYRQVEDGFYFGGLYDCSLRVVVRNEPFTSPHNVFRRSPTEPRRSALVCTPHLWDRVFPSLNLMFGTILNVFWNIDHQPNVLLKKWVEMSKEQALQHEWETVCGNIGKSKGRRVHLSRNSFVKLYPELRNEKFIDEPVAPLPSLEINYRG